MSISKLVFKTGLGATYNILGSFTDATNGGYSETELPTIPHHLKICDGTEITDIHSPLLNEFSPNLNDLALRGTLIQGNMGVLAGRNSIVPDTELIAGGDYKCAGTFPSHLHDVTHNHPLRESAGDNDDSTVGDLGALSAYTHRPHVHDLDLNSMSFDSGGATPTFDGNTTARSLWFESGSVTIELFTLTSKYYIRVL